MGTFEKSRMSAARLPLISELAKYPLLEEDEERALIRASSEGDSAAREKLILANLRLVVWVAKRSVLFAGEAQFPDLISAGTVGLIRAVDKVSADYANRFASYAIWWVRQSVWHALEDCTRAVQMPHKLLQNARKFSRTENQLGHKLFRVPSLLEVAAELGMTVAEARAIKMSELGEIALDDPMYDDDGISGVTFAENIPDESSLIAAKIVEDESLRRVVAKSLDVLSPRERQIIELRFGLSQHVPHTLTEVASILSVATERVRQIEVRALAKLRFSATFRGKQQMYRCS